MVWNKGLTKFTHPSVLKTSQTMKRKKLDNFRVWRDKMKAIGNIKSNYPDFVKNGDLAELIGCTLGDGHIGKMPRTESLKIVSNSNNLGFIKRYSLLIEKIFKKEPSIAKRKKSNCVDIKIYEKNISKRLGIPTGSRSKLEIKVPSWISSDRKNIIRYLRGLYEAEGSFCVHKPTCTYKLFFANTNKSMLKNVYDLLTKLEFHPHPDKYRVQISRKEEVYKLRELLQYRKY